MADDASGDDAPTPDADDNRSADARRTPADAALLLDVMLGKLATYLRMCGYDAAYALDRGVEADDALLDLAREEGRLLVTRDADLARRAASASGTTDDAGGLLLESREVTDQLREVRGAGFALALSEPTRCSACNAVLADVPDDADTPEYAPGADEIRVWRCPECGQHFWKGSHWDSVAATLADVRRASG